jgi:hypothetical protein
MKNLLVIAALVAAGYWFYDKKIGGEPQVIEDPVYGEVRLTAEVSGREIETVLFLRATGEADCQGRAWIGWNEVFEACTYCKLEPPRCQSELPARYSRLFDDVPIPSAYLSATAGVAGERDGRIVVFGLTDAEGIQFCELMKKQIASRYKGTLVCIPPNGG